MASYSEHVAEAIRREIDEAGTAWYLSRTPLDYARFFQSMPAEHLAFFLELRVYHRTGDVLCVHGGAIGVEALDESPADILIWGSPGFPDGYEATAPVVYGHRNNAVLDEAGWPNPRVTRNVAYGIDTIRHGVLTAMRFPDHRVVQSRRFDRV